ncbi:MAG: hypothetical protein AB7N76_30120 [Planctomycetota bacterium]
MARRWRPIWILLFSLLPFWGVVLRGFHALTHLPEQVPGQHAHDAPEQHDEDCLLCLAQPAGELPTTTEWRVTPERLEVAAATTPARVRAAAHRLTRVARGPPAGTTETL